MTKKDMKAFIVWFLVIFVFPFILLSLWLIDININTKLVSSEVREFKIISVNPPKHLCINMQDLKSGEIIKKVYVSKHFNDYKNKVFIGRIIKLKVNKYLEYNKKEIVVYEKVYETLQGEP
jgi:hypothetical protein